MEANTGRIANLFRMDTTGLLELTLSVGHWSMVAKVLSTFGVENEPEFLEANKDILPENGPRLPAIKG